MKTFINKIWRFLRSKWGIVTIAVILIIVGGYFLFFKKPPSYQFISVKQGSITESVSLTGNTTSQQAVSLAFGSSGTVSQTFRSLGTKVTAGKVLAELNMSDLVAQLHNAEAGLVLAKQQASASKNNVENVTAQQDSLVSSAYQNFLNSTIEAVPKDPSKGYPAPIISGNYILRREGKIDLHFYYSTGGISFEVSGLTEGTGLNNTVTSQPIGNSGLYLKGVSSQIDTPDWVIEIPNKKAANYLTNYNAYQQALDNRDKAIADAQASVGVDQSAVSQAQIEQAQAGVDGILAKIQNAKIVAPISGTITQFDAKVGQLATAGTPLISIISDEGYEVDAGVSETDVGKILVGNKVSMGLDAFPNEVFTGSVFYIAPAETNTQGVISYQLKIAFDKQDPRLKSGLTANADIETRNKDNVLILPQYAILQNDSGTFVEILENGAVKDVPVTLGIQDQQGNVEVLSGVTLAEQVLNIGLKVK